MSHPHSDPTRTPRTLKGIRHVTPPGPGARRRRESRTSGGPTDTVGEELSGEGSQYVYTTGGFPMGRVVRGTLEGFRTVPVVTQGSWVESRTEYP